MIELDLANAERLQTDLRSVAWAAMKQLITLRGKDDERSNNLRLNIIDDAARKMTKIVKRYKEDMQ